MKKRFVMGKPPGLMLTSLLDMFTIILIFLIVSFEAEDHNFQLNPDITLPASLAHSVFKPAVNVAISPDALIVEKETIAELKNFRANQEHYDAGEIPELVEELKLYYDNFVEMTKDLEEITEENDPAIIIIQANKDLDYETLYLVLRSASMAGFVRYRLAIMKK